MLLFFLSCLSLYMSNTLSLSLSHTQVHTSWRPALLIAISLFSCMTVSVSVNGLSLTADRLVTGELWCLLTFVRCLLTNIFKLLPAWIVLNVYVLDVRIVVWTLAGCLFEHTFQQVRPFFSLSVSLSWLAQSACLLN